MGNRQAVLSQEKLEFYRECSFFSTSEIVRLYNRFRSLNPEIVPSFMPNDCVESIVIPAHLIYQMPELKNNPFLERVVKIFSSEASGFMNFEDFLDMFNALNDQAPLDLKAIYAYKIFDEDEDNSLNTFDLKMAIKKLTRGKLSDDETDTVVEKVLEESEMDDDCEISFMEFEHVVTRSPDFKNTFRIRM